MEWLYTQDPHAFDDLLNNIGEATLPGMIPTAAIPIVEGFANRSTFTGRPIEPEAMRRLPAPARYLPWTTEFAKQMSAALYKSGIEISPLMLEQAIFSWTGGAGRVAMQAVSAPFGRDVPRASRGLADIPGVRAFAVRWPTTQAESVQRFYDRMAELEERYAVERAREENPDLPRGKPLSDDEFEELFWLRDNAQQLASVRSEMRQVQGSTATPSQKKREQIDALSLEMIDIAKDALREPERPARPKVPAQFPSLAPDESDESRLVPDYF